MAKFPCSGWKNISMKCWCIHGLWLIIRIYRKKMPSIITRDQVCLEIFSRSFSFIRIRFQTFPNPRTVRREGRSSDQTSQTQKNHNGIVETGRNHIEKHDSLEKILYQNTKNIHICKHKAKQPKTKHQILNFYPTELYIYTAIIIKRSLNVLIHSASVHIYLSSNSTSTAANMNINHILIAFHTQGTLTLWPYLSLLLANYSSPLSRLKRLKLCHNTRDTWPNWLIFTVEWPLLWSNSWLQIQRSSCYLIIWEVVGLERSPLSLVSTVEELLGRNSSGSGL
jgi:hypothetical protein